MNQDAILADSRRDGTHAFEADAGGLLCVSCRRPRWAHVDDGFRATLSNCDPKDTRYRSVYRCHPNFSKPQTMSNADRKEQNRQLWLAQQEEQRRIKESQRPRRVK